jgi:hypothetical protein
VTVRPLGSSAPSGADLVDLAGASPLPAAALADSEEHTVYQREVVHGALDRNVFVTAVSCEVAERRHTDDRVSVSGAQRTTPSATTRSRRLEPI